MPVIAVTPTTVATRTPATPVTGVSSRAPAGAGATAMRWEGSYSRGTSNSRGPAIAGAPAIRGEGSYNGAPAIAGDQ